MGTGSATGAPGENLAGGVYEDAGREMSVDTLAQALELPVGLISAIIDGKRGITNNVAGQLGAFSIPRLCFG